MTDEPRTLAEIEDLTYLGEIPLVLAHAWGAGTLVYQRDRALFLLDDPKRFPAAAREGVELRNTALVTGVCAECHALRPALVAPPGTEVVRFPRDPHTANCPASDAEIARAHDTPSDEGNTA